MEVSDQPRSITSNEEFLRALDTAPASNESVREVEDISVDAWLSQPEEIIGKVELNGRSLKIAAVTESEMSRLIKLSQRPDARNPRSGPQLDAALLRLHLIAFSLNKANAGSQVTPEMLKSKLVGTLTEMQNAIMRLSGMEVESDRQPANFFA